MTSSKHVLVMAYYFPPLAGPGMVKVLRNCRYLPEFGWHPFVLSVSNPERYACALNPLPKGLQVFYAKRIPGPDFTYRALSKIGINPRWLLLPDQFVGWIPHAFVKGLQLIQKSSIDVIYGTCPPYSTGLICALLKKATGLPMVLEMRDPWSIRTSKLSYPTPIHAALDKALERNVIRTADYVTCIYPIGLQHCATIMGEDARVDLIRPGFDPEDFNAQFTSNVKKIFRIHYAGEFYAPYHSLDTFLKGLKLAIEEEAGRFQFQYFGNSNPHLIRFSTTLGLDKIVKNRGYVPIWAAIRELQIADLLLLTLEFETTPTKVYEYLASGKPILYIGPPCKDLHDLFESYADSAYEVTDQDHFKVAMAIRDVLKRKDTVISNGITIKRKRFWEEQSAFETTRQLADILQKAVKSRNEYSSN